MRVETMILNEERNVSLTAYIQGVEGEFGFKKRPAMLVLPGGGYTICSDREVVLCQDLVQIKMRSSAS